MKKSALRNKSNLHCQSALFLIIGARSFVKIPYRSCVQVQIPVYEVFSLLANGEPTWCVPALAMALVLSHCTLKILFLCSKIFVVCIFNHSIKLINSTCSTELFISLRKGQKERKGNNMSDAANIHLGATTPSPFRSVCKMYTPRIIQTIAIGLQGQRRLFYSSFFS